MALPRRIVDAHHHFWDLGRNRHPWLSDEPPIAFRYGDYRALRRDYLKSEYLGDSAGYEVQGTVYVETEWDPADPRGEMRYAAELVRDTGLPTVAVGHTRLDAPDAADLLAYHAAFPFVRSIRHKPRANPRPGMAEPGGIADTAWRSGFAQLAPLGLRFDLQTPWRATSPTPRSSSTTPAYRPIAAKPAWPAGAPQWPRWPNAPT
jgi:predicted TIM-barrel fold metal-dependent hydrolase